MLARAIAVLRARDFYVVAFAVDFALDLRRLARRALWSRRSRWTFRAGRTLSACRALRARRTRGTLRPGRSCRTLTGNGRFRGRDDALHLAGGVVEDDRRRAWRARFEVEHVVERPRRRIGRAAADAVPRFQLSSMNCVIDACSVNVPSTKFGRAHGEITISGMRGPTPQRSFWAGGVADVPHCPGPLSESICVLGGAHDRPDLMVVPAVGVVVGDHDRRVRPVARTARFRRSCPPGNAVRQADRSCPA